MSQLLDAIRDSVSTGLDVLDMPGSYFRGAVVGRPGERLSGADLLKSLGLDMGNETADEVLGFGAGFATDPLTFAGGALGRAIGKLAGGAMDAASVARGPGYATKLDDIGRMIAGQGDDAAERFNELARSPLAGRLASEVPPNSSFLGAGQQGMAFRTPTNDVIRLGRVDDPIRQDLAQEAASARNFLDVPDISPNLRATQQARLDAANQGLASAGLGRGRPISDNVLQNTREIRGADGGSLWSAERSPVASDVGDKSFWSKPRIDDAGQLSESPRGELSRALREQGLALTDPQAANLGTLGGASKVVDPGAVTVTDAFTGGFQPVVEAAEPGPLLSQLLKFAGADARLRHALASGRNTPGLAADLATKGMFGGAMLGLPETSNY